MWVAVIAAISAILSPVVNGAISKRSPTTRADAAEKFTAMAARVAETNEKLEDEISSLKQNVLTLIFLIEEVNCDKNQYPELQAQLDKVKRKIYGVS